MRGGLVFLDGKLVILKRFNGVWLFPKGHIDPGETAELAAVREVKEECGLTAFIIGELEETSYNFRENNEEHHKMIRWYLMEASSEQIILEKGFFTDAKLIDENRIELLSFKDNQKLGLKSFQLYRKWKGSQNKGVEKYNKDDKELN